MPSYYSQVSSFGNASVEDVEKFARYQYYLVKNELKEFPRWNEWDQLFGSIPWQKNMGDVMKSTRPEHSPVGETFFYPNNITTNPNKNVYEVDEAYQQARVKRHNYESFPFVFLPSWRDFWTGQVKFKSDDIVRQIQVSNNRFIRTVAWQCARYVINAGTPDLTSATFAIEGQDDVKNEAWRINQIPNIKTNLTLNVLNRALINLREDLGAYAFEGVQNMPKDNEGIKGKYVLMCSSEAFTQFRYDSSVNDLKNVSLDLLFNDLNGSFWGQVVAKLEKFPIRFGRDGVCQPPEIVLDETAQGLGKRIIPNPSYVSLDTSPYEVAWIMGADAFKSIAIGPPPKEFASQNISKKKFYSLEWNGEVYATDQVLRVTYTGANVTAVDTNKYGDLLQLCSSVVHGCLPGKPQNCIPILFQRARNPVA